MSLSPYFYVEKWNDEKNCYEKISLYKKSSNFQALSHSTREEDRARAFEEVDFWPWNGTHEIFSMLGTNSRDNTFDTIAGVHHGEPPMVSEAIKKEIDDFFNEDSYYKSSSSVRWITLADLYIENLKNPKVLDYDEDWGENLENKVYKDNPIGALISRINTWVDLGGEDWNLEDSRSLVRLVYWVVW